MTKYKSAPRHISDDALDPRAYQAIVGATFAKHDHTPLISIGSRQWTRWQLGRLGCPHPSAAVRVARVVKTLQITTAAEFIKMAPVFMEYKDLGVTSYWVVLALVHDLGGDPNGVHGDRPSFATAHKHAMHKADHLVKKRRKDNTPT